MGPYLILPPWRVLIEDTPTNGWFYLGFTRSDTTKGWFQSGWNGRRLANSVALDRFRREYPKTFDTVWETLVLLDLQK